MIAPPQGWRLLSEAALPCAHDLGLSVAVDHIPWGAVTRRDGDGALWRAVEDEARGRLLLHAEPRRGEVSLRAWAPADSAWTAEEAQEMATGWAGLRDDAEGEDLLNAHPVTRELRRRLGPLRLSRLPSVQEAIGRAILGQLVQFREAERSAAELVRLAGTEIAGLRAWPTATAVQRVAAWDLRRRCGVSLRGARSLHAAAQDAPRLDRLAAAGDWEHLDRCLRALPGVGVWTSAEARLALGDADAVPFGDYHLPNLVGHALGGAEAPDGGWTDEHLAELLEPFRPHRGRAARLIVHGVIRKLGPRPERRAPHAAYSKHRYW